MGKHFTPSPERGRLAYRDPDQYIRRYGRDPRAMVADKRAYYRSDLYRHDLHERVRAAIEAAERSKQ